MSTRLQLICVAVLAALGGAVAWHHAHAPRRPQYVLINETGQHDFDLAFRMSLKLAENKSGIENALVLLQSLEMKSGCPITRSAGAPLANEVEVFQPSTRLFSASAT